jgi:hypothetical protein
MTIPITVSLEIIFAEKYRPAGVRLFGAVYLGGIAHLV